ncbi:MAG TPA: TonB-dependent receptor [Sphingobium sp.]|nr:TonB-dependent receptor [Sphingobium sp.]
MLNMKKVVRLYASAAAVALVLSPAIVRAQEKAIEGAAPEADHGVAEIIVTAQKRQQSAQDVGITMSVVSGDTLTQQNVTTPSDLVTLIPNLQANFGAGQIAFNMRGIGMNEFSANFDSPIAVNVDEVYLSKNFMSNLVLFDIDRVEALKGPQGTLFGRNSTGGTVNFYTRRPTDELQLGGTIGYGNYQTVRGEGYVSGPLGGGFSARLSGMFVDQNKGWYRNLVRGDTEGFERKWALRGQLAWEGASTTALLTVNYGRDTGENPSIEGVGVVTPASFAAGMPVFCQPFIDGTVGPGDSGCVRGTDGQYPGDTNPFTSTTNTRHQKRHSGFGASLRVEQDFGSTLLTSLTSYQDYTRQQKEDSDGSPTDQQDIHFYNTIKQFTQELRLSSNKAGIWNWVVGGYYEHDDYNNGDYLVMGGGALPGIWSPFEQKVDALALFFHNDIAVTDSFSIIAGVRYSKEWIGIRGGTDLAVGLQGPHDQPSAVIVPLSIANDDKVYDSSIFKLGVQWKPRIDSAFVDKLMLYANVSTGFRSGAYNAEFATAQEAFTSLSPETITAYEAGFKSLLANRTLQVNGSVFHNAFKDGFINVDSAFSPIPITINAANINAYGVELETLWQPSDTFSINLAGGWLDSKIISDITINGESLKGNRTVQSPEWTFSGGASYSVPVGDRMKLVFSGDASWRSSQFFETTNSPTSHERPYWLVNGRISLNGPDDRWSLAVWGKNLTKTEYRTYENDLAQFGFLINIYGLPRTYGASLSFKF